MKDYENIEFLGCFADYAWLNPEFREDKYYHWGVTGATDVAKIPDLPKSLPNRDKVHFVNYGDGPTRLIPSIDTASSPLAGSVSTLIKRGYRLAKLQGFRWFALQKGVVFATNQDPTPAATKLDCPSKIGAEWKYAVYRIKDLDAPDEADVHKDPFEKYRYPEPIVQDKLNCPKPVDEPEYHCPKRKDQKAEWKPPFDLRPNQLFTQATFKPSIPQKGRLINASAGAGKTGDALNAAANFMVEDWQVIWITRKSLRTVPEEELYDNISVTKLRDIILDPNQPLKKADGTIVAGGPLPGDAPEGSEAITKRKIQEKAQYIQGGDGRILLKNRFKIELLKKNIMSYDDFVRVLRQDTMEHRALYREWTDNPNGDVGYRKLFVVDEAHNFTNPDLEISEREFLDAKINSITISGKTYSSVDDVYGPNIVTDHHTLEGRDLFPAMLYASYEISGDESAKSLILTATPKLLWTLNLFQVAPELRLPLNLEHYYDPLTLELVPEAVAQITRVAYGHVAYLDISRDPSMFAQKVLTDIISVSVMPFHQQLIWEKSKDVVSHFRNVALCAKLNGPVYSERQLELMYAQKYAVPQTKSIEDYDAKLPAVMHAFGVKTTDKAKQKYAKEDAQIRSVVNELGDLRNFESWQRVFKPKKDRKTYDALVAKARQGLPSFNEWLLRNHALPKKLTPEQRVWSDFVIRDPSTGKLRIKTRHEYLSSPMEPSLTELNMEPEEKHVSFLCWKRDFHPDKVRALLPYYAPCIHVLIQNIRNLEASAKKVYGHGFKHCVFTFSANAKGSYRHYGSGVILSAFAAYPDEFQIMVSYEEKKHGDKTVRCMVNNNKHGKVGVSCLSSGEIPAAQIQGNEKSYPAEIDYNVSKIRKATNALWNSDANRHGDLIKIMILDAAFQEGVNNFDVAYAHYLPDAGVSRDQALQSSARNTRMCGSKRLPFYRDTGAFVRAFVYDPIDVESGVRLYDELMRRVDVRQKIEWNVTEALANLAEKVAIDAGLNEGVHAYRAYHTGHVIGKSLAPFDACLDVAMPLEFQEGRGVKTIKERLIVPVDYIVEKNPKKGDPVTFEIPDAIDMLQRYANVGDYRNVRFTQRMEETFVNPGPLPTYALLPQMPWVANVNYFLLGILGMLRQLYEQFKISPVQLYVSLPPRSQDYQSAPSHTSYGLVWRCNDERRTLDFDANILRDFLRAKQGISVLFLFLESALCKGHDKEGQVNVLIYIPKWRTIERFSPAAMSYAFDTTALDAKLYDLFLSLDPTNTYVSLAEESWPSELVTAELTPLLTLLYAQMRIYYFAKISDYRPKEPIVFPAEFQRGVLRALNDDNVNEYLNGYGRALSDARTDVREHYDANLPWWSNVVNRVHALQHDLLYNAPPSTWGEGLASLAQNVLRGFGG